MQGGSIEGAEVPEDAPDEADAATGVEHSTPSKLGDDERAQWISQSDADAEPWI